MTKISEPKNKIIKKLSKFKFNKFIDGNLDKRKQHKRFDYKMYVSC